MVRLRDLHGGDVERRRQVGQDRVDLAVVERLLGWLVSSKTSGSCAGSITSRIAVSDVVPVWAPSLRSLSSASAVASAAVEPLSATTAWAAE